MKITQEDRKIFEKALELIQDDQIGCCVTLKVLHTFLQKISPVKVDLPADIQELLEHRHYSENNPDIFEELRKCWSTIADVAQDAE
ncbi:hypothetical protein [Brevibacillus borstelensis]|uniref:hypothetical protein n=1 Tax=Brevibacillus borstelensis TaxID=45462 RepID=UPI00156234CD|nr:hypothetical protein [Brevibacillus borstelensis]MBE5394939.1 hypothetical protein [Brevibacillus borstelensis]MCM3472224.1 hypothetical protein [Brevibacillus borstelensis]WNF05482.1 hypothetical protein RFB14_24655 [Brevibacillus borstelensis]